MDRNIKNRTRLIGECGKGKSIYTNKEGYFKQKNTKELAEAKKKKGKEEHLIEEHEN